MVISHAFCIDNIRIFLHFRTDHGRKVNCSYSWITCVISLVFFSILMVVKAMQFLRQTPCYSESQTYCTLLCSQTNTNNINKTLALLQTNGSKDKPNNIILFYKNFPFLPRVVSTIFQQIVVIPAEIKYTPLLVPLIYKAS